MTVMLIASVVLFPYPSNNPETFIEILSTMGIASVTSFICSSKSALLPLVLIQRFVIEILIVFVDGLGILWVLEIIFWFSHRFSDCVGVGKVIDGGDNNLG